MKDGKDGNILVLGEKLTIHTPLQYKINCNVDPVTPEGSEVKEHIKGGIIHLDSEKQIGLYTSVHQKHGERISGHRLLFELRGHKNVFNANAADYWLANPSHIPKRKFTTAKSILFMHTTFRLTLDDSLCVRRLFKLPDGTFDLDFCSLDNHFGEECAVAIFERRINISDRRAG